MEAIIITSIYSIIRAGASKNQLVTVTSFGPIGIMGGVFLKLGVQLAVRGTEASQKISELGNILSWSRHDKQFFKSCNAIKWNVGNCFTVDSGTFNRIMNNIVISTVINLLLTY